MKENNRKRQAFNVEDRDIIEVRLETGVTVIIFLFIFPVSQSLAPTVLSDLFFVS